MESKEGEAGICLSRATSVNHCASLMLLNIYLPLLMHCRNTILLSFCWGISLIDAFLKSEITHEDRNKEICQ